MPNHSAHTATPLTATTVTPSYPDVFHREMTPTWLQAASIALGRRTLPAGAPFVWMELGCGAGMGALLTAAAHPEGRCIGVDINPTHIDMARERAAATGVGNVEFLLDDVERMTVADDDAFPRCDYIVLHGVYAWVTSKTRAAIREVIRRWLKPGGLVYVAYMSHPGASGLAAAQRLLRLSALTHGVEDGLGKGVALLRQLEQAKAGYFVATPTLGNQITGMEQEDAAYLAHEFLSADWQPLHVADVMKDFAEVGCSYVGSATLIENIDSISIPGAVQPLLQGMTDPATAETLRDIARNQSLRRDIYQRTEVADVDHERAENRHTDGQRTDDAGTSSHQDWQLSPDAHRTLLLNQTIAALPGAPARGPLRLDTRIGAIEAPDAWFTPLLQALSRGPASYADIARLQPYARQPGFLNQAFLTLFWAGCAHPVRIAANAKAATPSTATATPTSSSTPDLFAQAWRLNAWLTRQPGRRHWLLAPTLSTAIEVPEWQARIAQTLLHAPATQPNRLIAAHPDIDRATMSQFLAATLPGWIACGIVPAGR